MPNRARSGRHFRIRIEALRRLVLNGATASWLALAGGLLGASIAAAAADPGPLEHLPGRWSGWGAITMSSGQTEQVKCVATYFVSDARRLEQNLRCASASYKIDSKALLEVASDQVRGHWEERTNAAAGSVSGRVTGSGFNLSIQGDNFTAVMAVSTSPCKQSINIAPQGTDIRRIAIGLDKC